MEHLKLNLFRERRGEALNIEFFRIQPHWFDKKLMPFFVGKCHNLGLNARTIAWADAFDYTGVDRAAVQIGTDDSVRFLIGIGQIADSFVFRCINGGKRKRFCFTVALLDFHF